MILLQYIGSLCPVVALEIQEFMYFRIEILFAGEDVIFAKRDPVGLQIRAQLRELRQAGGQVRRVHHKPEQGQARQHPEVSREP